MVRRDGERSVVALDCCVVTAEVGERGAQVDERLDMLRINSKRPLIACDGLLSSRERVEYEPAIVERIRAVGRDRKQRVEGPQRLLEISQLDQCDAAAHER